MLLGFLLLSVLCSKAQQPAYFIFGEDQFRGVHVYDVIQDNELNYWFATNEGIYLYDHIEFKRVDCEKSKGNSVYNFITDEKGVIYCHNLNNQVFRIKDKKCQVLYELTEIEGGADVSLAIADNGNLLVASRWIIVLTPEGKVLQRKEIKKYYIGPPLNLLNKTIVYHMSASDTLLVYSSGKFEFKNINWIDDPDKGIQVLKFLKFNDGYIALDYKTKKVYRFDPSHFSFSDLKEDNSFNRSESVRMYETSKGVWIAGTLPGVTLKEFSTRSSSSVFYEDYFVSDVFEDVEGNILISTFDKGVLVIPNLKVPDVIHSFKEDPVTTLHSNGDGGLLLGTSKGRLLNYSNGKITAINEQGKRPIEVIGGNINSEWNIIDNGHIRAIHKKSGKIVNLVEASLKDIICVSETVCYLGTNRGLLKVINSDGNFTVEVVKEINQRVHFMEYDPKNQTLYLSTANGIISRNNQGKIKSIRYKNEDLFPNDFYFHEGTLFICSKENGLLTFKNGKFTEPIRTVVNGQIQTLKKIIFYRGTIIAQGTNGFYQFDFNGNLLKSLHTIYGLSSKRVIDFTFHKGQLWVSHTGGVQKIDLNYKPNDHVRPVIRIDRIYINGSEIGLKKKNHFSANERRIQFYFSSPSLKNRETIRYHYRLLGNDTTWSVSENGANQVRYNALSSGDYIFQVKTENQGVFSEIESYEFKIALPIYLRWWFISIAFVLFVGFVYLIYRRQLAVQQRKSEQINELHASKLTAIQSQMNPHFIFNSLNSIQDLILKGDVEHSYSYITTFSNLVRRTLNYSEKDFIDFEQEIKLLELYLSLEKLRFKRDFHFNMDYEGVEDVMVPPLLVQPFIENALVHGLLHKEGEKRLQITFRLEDYLICTIEDNGIGRKASREIKQRQRLDHESFSSEAIRKRFDILSKVFEGEFGYEFVDLFEDGKPVGTKVIMKIPVKHKF